MTLNIALILSCSVDNFYFLDNIVLTADGVRLVTSLSIVICMYGLMLVSGLDIMLIILDSTRQYHHYIGDY